MAWLAQYLVANAVTVCLISLIYPLPPFHTRKRAALAGAGLFCGSVFATVIIRILPILG
jgi:hypothetical protein